MESESDEFDNHPTVEIYNRVRGKYIPVDVRIAPLISKLWEFGFVTYGSCQDNYVMSTRYGKRKQFVWIQFEASDAFEFINYFINDDVEKYELVNDNWEISIQLDNANSIYSERLNETINNTPLKITFAISVRFPIKHLSKVEQTFYL